MDIKIINQAFALMVEAEMAVAGLYKACDAKWPEESKLWESLVAEEISHAQKIEKMLMIFSDDVSAFSQDKPVHPFIIEMFIEGIHQDMLKVSGNKLTKQSALILCRDVENSIIERNFLSILKSTNEQYEAIKEEIMSQTVMYIRPELQIVLNCSNSRVVSN